MKKIKMWSVLIRLVSSVLASTRETVACLALVDSQVNHDHTLPLCYLRLSSTQAQ